MMPFMNPPNMRRMHEAMYPIMTEVGDHEIAQQADQERHLRIVSGSWGRMAIYRSMYSADGKMTN